MDRHRPRLLYIDAYDSFANNIVALLETELEADVQVIEHDDPRFVGNDDRFLEFLLFFDAAVAGPGPGDPRNDPDIGIIKRLWTLRDRDVLPVLGICLGFQSLCKEFGAEIEKLNMPRHGMVNPVFHNGVDIFKGIGKFQVTSYHSLRVKTRHLPNMNHRSERISPEMWASDENYPTIKPLAWDVTDGLNGPVLMAARHAEKPLWGVQYHPESICTTEEGRRVVSGWWREANIWTQSHPRNIIREPVPRPERREMADRFRRKSVALAAEHASRLRELALLDIGDRVIWKSIWAPTLDAQEVSRLLCSAENEAVILQSGKASGSQPVDEQLGRYSIISVLDPAATIRFQYDVASHTISVTGTSDFDGATSYPAVILSSIVEDVFSYLREIMLQLQCEEGPDTIPFWGGLMGYISYEAGLETISVSPGHTMDSVAGGTRSRPDINFALVTRSVVIDHLTGYAFVQSILRNDSDWAVQSQGKIVSYLQPQGCNHNRSPHSRVPPHKRSRSRQNGVSHAENTVATVKQEDEAPVPTGIKVTSPERESYISKINKCLTSIRNGDSYELCLTDANTLHIPAHSSTPAALQGWHLFRRLTHANPAPFAAYLRLHSHSATVTLAGSSPERFLRWTRAGRCQFRPIKGTVRKCAGVTRARAEELLASAKERAENLMITDLVRHDLHGVVGRSGVSVPRLMQVEEYATVFQLVSVIEGAVPPATAGGAAGPNGHGANGTGGLPPRGAPLGIDVLAASLPPGSMTGAPKRRSCEILARIEGAGRPRGVYSGVLGYLDVGGAGDFAVVIRTACRWDPHSPPSSTGNGGGETGEEREAERGQEWCVGAGGAITALSDAADEWVEMLTKLNAVLGAVGVQVG